MNSAKSFFIAYFFVLFIIIPEGWSRFERESRRKCFVVMQSPPVLRLQHELSGGNVIRSDKFKAGHAAMKTYAAELETGQESVFQKIRIIDRNAKIGRRYTHLVNAFTVNADIAVLNEIADLPGVDFVVPVKTVKPMLTASGEQMELSLAWNLLGGVDEAGKGVFIAVIDTGIDVTHPAFDDTGFEYPDGFPKGNPDHTNRKVISAWFFPSQYSVSRDVAPFDQIGHGTNVASIAASVFTNSPLGQLSGVAPQAYLGNYKVIESDDADEGQVIDAVEQAVLDGVDIINISLGSDQFADPQHNLQVVAIQNAIDLGVTVVVAAGNEGQNRKYTIGSPAQIEDVIAVGSITNSHTSMNSPDVDELLLSVQVDGEIVAEDILAVFGGNGGPFTESILGSFVIKDIDLLDGGEYGGLENGLLCEPLELTDPLDCWVLVQRGICTFVDKIQYIYQAGGKGVIFYDNEEDSGDQPFVEGTTIPSMMVNRAAGLLIKDALLNGTDVRIDIHGKSLSVRSQIPNRLSNFSSAGPSVGYSLKPDVVAIGEGSFGATQNDIATQSTFVASGFDWFLGTSMAAPRVSGLAALVKQKHPHWYPQWIKSAISLSAKRPVMMSANSSQEANVLERGMGRVHAADALDVDTVVVPPMIGFGVHQLYADSAVTRWITIVNVLDRQCEYTLELSSELNVPPAVITETYFSLDPGEQKELEIGIQLTRDLPEGDLENELILNNLTSGRSYSIPYWVQIQFEEEPMGDVLLVDDDEDELFELYYMDRLDEIGCEFTWWDVNAREKYPTLSYMKNFKTVLWFLSESTLNSIPDETSVAYMERYNLRHLFETDLTLYLTEGGTLFLSGQDYFDDKEFAAFSQEVLQVRMIVRDAGATTVQGVSRNPIGDGLGPFTLTFPDGYDNFPDDIRSLSNNVTTSAFFSDGNSRRTVGVNVDAGSYRAVFLAFPLEVLDANAGNAILRNSLEWMQQSPEFDRPGLIRMVPDMIDTSTEEGPYSVTIEGTGFALRRGYRAYLDFVTIQSLYRSEFDTLIGKVPAEIESGIYNLRVVSGDGHELRLPHALTVSDGTITKVPDWPLY